MKYLATIVCALVLVFGLAEDAQAQVTLPAASPYATVSEQVGLTDVTVTYGRPGVNDREIWGNVVPYGLTQPFPTFGSGNPFPWRVGANENTVVTFEDDMLVEGEPLAAGSYGLHMIPAEEGDWTVIFSHNDASWGSFFYDPAEDALRVDVTPVESHHTERLTFTFEDHEGTDQVTLAMRWERLRVPIRLQVQDVHEVVIASLSDELRSRGGFAWQGNAQAANYALQNNVHLDKALAWSTRALSQNEVFNTLALNALALIQTGSPAEAEPVLEKAIAAGNEGQINALGYRLMSIEQMEHAREAFAYNVEQNPESWNAQDSLAEWYANSGDTSKAREHYQKALSMLPEDDETNRTRINELLADLGT